MARNKVRGALRWACGKPIRSRSPLAQRPWLRVMLVAVHVSSMNTRRSGSRPSYPSNPCRRCLRTSGRSCSIACPVFFPRDAVTLEEAMHRADPDRCATLDQRCLNLGQGHVALLCDQFLDQVAMHLDLALMPITAARFGNCLTMLNSKLAPADCTQCADPKMRRSCAATHNSINCRNNPVPKIL